jgi:hypothetical protein
MLYLADGREPFPYRIVEGLLVIRPQSRIDPAESPVNTTQVFVTHPSTCWRLGEWNKQGVWLNI